MLWKQSGNRFSAYYRILRNQTLIHHRKLKFLMQNVNNCDENIMCNIAHGNSALGMSEFPKLLFN